MSSDRCEELLVGLVSGDFGDEQERAAREEIGRCEAHASSLAKVDVGARFAAMLPSVDPRRELDDAILAAARAKASASAKTAPMPVAAGREAGFFARALVMLRKMAAGPQLAMATVMLLVVATGLWYLPARHHAPDADGDTVMAPQLSEEIASSPAASEPPGRRDGSDAVARSQDTAPKPEPRLQRAERVPEAALAAPAEALPEQEVFAARSRGAERRSAPTDDSSGPGALDRETIANGAAPNVASSLRAREPEEPARAEPARVASRPTSQAPLAPPAAAPSSRA
ncbi:MAG: hypothetical protein H5U40_06245, partial [Polyangiaceae bacterium]|nr:hypothetical protein [Polyangiaceae bacterium]